MKKILTCILLTLTVLVFSGITNTTANAEEREFEPAVIEKPDYLPGPVIDPAATDTQGGLRKVLGQDILPKLGVSFVGWVAIVALVFLVIGGVRFAMSYGNEEAIEKAKNQIIYALVGLIIALLSYTIVALIANIRFEATLTTTALADSINIDDELLPKVDDFGYGIYYKDVESVGDLPLVTFEGAAATVVKTLLGWSMLITIVALVVASIYYIMSRGQEEDIGKAKSIILYLVLGIAIMAAAYGIVAGILKFEFF